MTFRVQGLRVIGYGGLGVWDSGLQGLRLGSTAVCSKKPPPLRSLRSFDGFENRRRNMSCLRGIPKTPSVQLVPKSLNSTYFGPLGVLEYWLPSVRMVYSFRGSSLAVYHLQ